MTGNLVLDLAISLVGIAILVLISYFLGALRNAVVTEAAAMERIAGDEPDFKPTDWLIDSGGKSAIGVSGEGEAVIVFSHGDRLASRRFKTGERAVSHDGALITIALDELALKALSCAARDETTAAHWVGVLRGRDVNSRDGVS
ncbi:MAG: hypothetical protein AAF224_13545 [Pseudomonadota bacterium]